MFYFGPSLSWYVRYFLGGVCQAFFSACLLLPNKKAIEAREARKNFLHDRLRRITMSRNSFTIATNCFGKATLALAGGVFSSRKIASQFVAALWID